MTTRASQLAQRTRPLQSRRLELAQTLYAWLSTWEIYPILLVASFLRFYQLSTTEFDADQAILFRMAHDAVAHGLLPATGNVASIGVLHFPIPIYLLMIPAAFSANPLGGVLLVAFLNVVAVLLTYIFARRYFGRVAGLIAALFFATASRPVFYSRFIWQPNLIVPFVILFLILLYRGAVERRKGWLFPALFLLGFLMQIHETTALLAIPLLVALALAPETLRWRDLTFGLLSLLVMYFPFLLWESSTKFADVRLILQLSKASPHMDNVAITYYRDFFSPYEALSPPFDPHTLVYQLFPVLFWLHRFMLVLVVGGLLAALVASVPVTVFDAAHCLVLPNSADGPAVFLVGPYDQLTTVLLKQYAAVILIDQPPRLGSDPFRLYIVQSRQPATIGALNQAFIHHLQLLDRHIQLISYNQMFLLATRWQLLSSEQPNYRTTYTYVMSASFSGHTGMVRTIQSLYTVTSMHSGDQLIVTFPLPANIEAPASVSITATFYIARPYILTLGPVHLETIQDHWAVPASLQTTNGGNSLVLPSIR